MKPSLFVFALMAGYLLAGQDHGGGFAYSKTSRQLLEIAKAELTNQLITLEDFPWKSRNLDLSVLTRLLQTTRKEYEKRVSRVNPVGENEPLSFNWGREEDGTFYLEALEPFFKAYAEREITDQTILQVKQRLLHEAAHVFGYETEEKAEALAKSLLPLLEKRPENAGRELKVSVRTSTVSRNTDGSVNFSWPVLYEYDGGLPVDISYTSSPESVCSRLGYKKVSGIAPGDIGFYKIANINKKGDLEYRFAAEDPENQEYTQALFRITCSQPKRGTVENVEPIPEIRERAKRVTVLDGWFTITQPYLVVGDGLEVYFHPQSDEKGVCAHLGFSEAKHGSLTTLNQSSSESAVIGRNGSIRRFADSQATLSQVVCRGVDPKLAAIRYAERDKDREHYYGGEDRLSDTTEVLTRLPKEVAQKIVPKENEVVVKISYTDCTLIDNYLLVDKATGAVKYLFPISRRD